MQSAWTDIEVLTSRQNSTIKDTLALHKESMAKKQQQILVEGIRQLDTAWSKLKFEYLLFEDSDKGYTCYQSLLSKFEVNALEEKTELRRVERNLFQTLAQTVNSQGVLAVARVPQLQEVSKLKPLSQGRYLLLENTNDPGNLGTIIRTCEGLGFSAILLYGDVVWPFNSKVLRSAMGSVFHIPLYQVKSLEEVSQLMDGFDFLVADMDGTPLSDYEPTTGRGFILMLGNEARGVSTELIQLADSIISIEMLGQAESYNLGVSAGVLAWYLSKIYGYL